MIKAIRTKRLVATALGATFVAAVALAGCSSKPQDEATAKYKGPGPAKAGAPGAAGAGGARPTPK